MFEDIKEKFIQIATSRLTVLMLIVCALGGGLIFRCFYLQIVHGQEYLDQFVLETEKTRDISSTRGEIVDRNGIVLAYDELAYAVKMEDVFESGRQKNAQLNATLYALIGMVEKNGDSIITDFNVVLDENNEFVYNVEGNSLLRFLADVYGRVSISDLKESEKNSTPDELIEYMGSKSGTGFAIGAYEVDGDSSSKFVVGKGYTKKELLQLITLRYAMKLTSYRKYIGTTVASDVSEKTVAVIMENASELPGVSIQEETVRRYNDSKYFSHILGYTGKISSEELTALNESLVASGGEEKYTITDVVGKSGIEAYMETTLQGDKGYERVSVDNMGRVTSILEHSEAVSGDKVWLTIDSETQKATYNILEQKIAGIVADKIINTKEFYQGENSSGDIKIPIYDVYYSVINNSIADVSAFGLEDAGEVQKRVYASHESYKEGVYDRLRREMFETGTVYKQLSKEYQVYESNLVSLLIKSGVLLSNRIVAEDPTQIAWATDEVISLREYLQYIIAQNWIDVTKLELDDPYSDAEEIYESLVEYSISMLDRNIEFQKKLYKYMLLGDMISGRDICMILCEQNAVEIPIEDEEALYAGKLSAYQFMMNRITSLEITPAQLALDPCNGSVVITDIHTGDVLAMVSYPGYDNNMMANSVDAEYYAKLMSDKSSPSLNYATQYKAAPGSTFKMVSAAAGLMEGIISTGTQIRCVGTFSEINPSPRCWLHSGHGNQDVTQAIENSCNYFFFRVGYDLSFTDGSFNAQTGLDKLADYASRFGLSERSGVEIAEYEPDLSTEDPVRSAIGQGSNSYTTVALARYVSTVANGGTNYKLTLLDKVTNSRDMVLQEFDPVVTGTIEMPASYWNAIHLGMRKVVENKSYFSDLAVHVAGKTGTAQQIKSRPNHALFVGYAPYENPEIAIATRIPFGYSSDYAAQTTRDIIRYYYGLAQEEEIITGTADAPDAGVSTNEF